MTPDEIADAKKRASTPTRSEWLALIAALEEAQRKPFSQAWVDLANAHDDAAMEIDRLRAENEALRGQVAALRAAVEDCPAAAREHDEAVSQKAREEERGACAKIAEDHWNSRNDDGFNEATGTIAAAIPSEPGCPTDGSLQDIIIPITGAHKVGGLPVQ